VACPSASRSKVWGHPPGLLHHPEKLLPEQWSLVVWKMPLAGGWRGLDLPGMQDIPVGRWSPLIPRRGNMMQSLPFLGARGDKAGLLGQQQRRGTADFKAPQCAGVRHAQSPQVLGRGRRGSSQHQEGSRTM